MPVDIKSTYPKTEETFSLRTKDPREALILVRKAAAEVDERFAAHRRKIAGLQAPPARELTKGQLARLEEVYHAHLLEEDEAVRLDGFYEDVDPLPWEPRLTFEEREAQAREFGDDTRFQLARGKSDVFWRSEVEEVLTWDGLGIRLDPASASWKLAERALQSAAVRAHDDIARRNKGDVVPTPELPDIAKQDAHLASMVRAEWIAEKSKLAGFRRPATSMRSGPSTSSTMSATRGSNSTTRQTPEHSSRRFRSFRLIGTSTGT